MRVRKLLIVGTGLLISASIFLLWREGASTKEKSLESLYGSVGIQEITPPIKAPDFTLENLEGSQVSLKDLEGKVVFLNFWAIPTTYLLDPEGRIVGKALGARDWTSEDAFDLIEHLLPETKAD